MKRFISFWFISICLPCFCMMAAHASPDDEAKVMAREHYLRGNIYYQQGKYKEAEEEFQKSLAVLAEAGVSVTQGGITPPAAVQPPKTPEAPRSPQQFEYLIGYEDVLQISVWQNPDLDQEAIVRPDGKISFPLIGDVQAAGLSITQLDQEITERLKEYVKYPEVSLSIKRIGGKRVIVMGEVSSPGVYTVTGSLGILEAIGMAGGFNKDAVSSSVILIRGGFENPKPRRLNLARALSGDLRQNVPLQSEDIIFVPKKFIANLNYFLDQVIGPLAKGAYTAKSLQTY